MSGIFGYFSTRDVSAFQEIYFGLYALQHRGQQSVGIATLHDEGIDSHIGRGQVKRNFAKDWHDDLRGNKGLGFVKYKFRYDTTMPDMPIVHNGGLLAIDGIITNDDFTVEELTAKLESVDISIIREYLQQLQGAFTICYISQEKMIAYRDLEGIKPLCIGYDKDTAIIATESCAFEATNTRFVRDMQPGELFVHTLHGQTSYYLSNEEATVCAFEYVYTARPDSVIDGRSVYEARYRMGEKLFEESPVDADIVIGAPDSGIIAALGYANASGIDYQQGFIRNNYIGRTFIEMSQAERERGVTIKLTPIRVNIQNQDIILVDDSIVRGTTIKRIVKNLKDKGANKVHVRISAPEIVKSNNVTVDIPDEEDLISANHTVEEMVEIIGCDSLAFLSLGGMHKAVGTKNLYQDYFLTEEETN